MLSCQRGLFSLDEKVTFLNCAYMSPQLKAVTAAGTHAMAWKERPNRIAISDFFEPVQRIKSLYADLVNAPADRIALVPSVSYGMAAVAMNAPVRAGDEILLAHDQFPSNYYAWERLAAERGAKLRVVGASNGPDKGRRWNEALLEAINARTRVVALAQVHWSEGITFNLAALRARSRDVGAWLVIDGTQSVGALPFDVAELQPDALVVAAYKWLMGPYATGLAYYGPALDDGRPVEENWINRQGSEDFRRLVNYQSAYQMGAARYSVGEHSNFVLNPMLEAALQQIKAWDVSRIQDYCRQLNEPFLNELSDLGVEVLPRDQRPDHLLCLRLPAGKSMERLQSALTAASIFVSVRGDAIRVAPNVYNRGGDWERLLEVLRKL